MGPRTKQTFLQRRHTDDQQTHEKMLNDTHYERNGNQNYNEVSPHTGQNGQHKKSTNNKFQRGCGGKGMLLHCWCECKLIQPLWKMVWRFLLKLGIKPLSQHDPAIPPLGIYPEETRIEKDTCIPLFMQHYLQQLEHGSHLDVH